MYAYTPPQWVLLFFFYGFLGWVWECCYVSAREGRWIDRGFLQGPVLPIYGSGAIIVLHATLPHAQDPLATAVLGCLWATVLEYAVGAAMEGLFHVRYWDYSTQPWNLHGHICLKSSLAWGVFSLLLVRYIHPPADRLVQALPGGIATPLAGALIAVLTADTIRSARSALDLKEILLRLSRENDEVKRISQRVEALCARTAEEAAALRRKIAPDDLGATLPHGGDLEEALGRLRESRLQAISAISQALEGAVSSWAADRSPAAKQRRREAEGLLAHLRRHPERPEPSVRRPGGALRLLRSNPNAVARGELQEALSALRRHLGR